ncbi:HesB/YadR/YfhF family protein [Vagococcus sp.]|uniref:HesB/YadR/YfhF family protein n=1 Tax=Vagococcus sp. TaxID=1933889 RepID=UPI003F95DA89
MKIELSDKAHQWFVDELDLDKGDYLRIFGKYGGKTNIHVGFSTGINVVEPTQMDGHLDYKGITYFTEEADEWFFGNHCLVIDYDESMNEPIYTYK